MHLNRPVKGQRLDNLAFFSVPWRFCNCYGFFLVFEILNFRQINSTQLNSSIYFLYWIPIYSFFVNCVLLHACKLWYNRAQSHCSCLRTACNNSFLTLCHVLCSESGHEHWVDEYISYFDVLNNKNVFLLKQYRKLSLNPCTCMLMECDFLKSRIFCTCVNASFDSSVVQC